MEPTHVDMEKDFKVFSEVDIGESSEFGSQPQVIVQINTN